MDVRFLRKISIAGLALLLTAVSPSPVPSPVAVGAFGCPMHPEMRAASPGTCPVCGMTLVPMGPPGSPPARVTLVSVPEHPSPGEPLRLKIEITDPATGARVRDFQIVHEKLIHLFVVGSDLATYDHIHPAQLPDGTFEVVTALPHAGTYYVFSDFLPAGGTPQIVRSTVTTAGAPAQAPPARLTADRVLTKVVDGTRFELSLEPPRTAAGAHAALMLHLVDERTGAPVTDLEPYLGAWGHALILDADALDCVHTHPTRLATSGSASGGPDVAFNAVMRRPGAHRIWAQFKRAGKVTTVDFTIDVGRVAHLAAWDGLDWVEPGPRDAGGPDGPVRALAIAGDGLVVGGEFVAAGGRPAARIARWDGKRWSALGAGLDGPVWAIAVAGSDVYAGGEFAATGQTRVNGIARWDGTRWHALGEGVGGSRDQARPAAVYALALRGRDLIAGGRFTTAGGVNAEGIARWDGRRWSPLGTGVSSGDRGSVVWSLAVSGPDLFAGGEFVAAGRVPARNVARWDGTAWSALGTGVAGGLEKVAALAASGGKVFAAGDFTEAGGTSAGRIAVWDGTRWAPLTLATTESIRALAMLRDELFVAGGSFRLPGGRRTTGLVRYDGRQWWPLADGLGSGAFLAPVLAIAAGPGRTYAGGGPVIVR